jgi:energy-coupling factor transport system substrate-specific component
MRRFDAFIPGAAALISLLLFGWPLVISKGSATQTGLAQTLFLVLMPLLLLMVISQVSSGLLNSRQIAVLGVLIALNSAIRMLGAGTGGIETAFFLIVIGGYALGSSFGYLLGTGSLLVSALVTGGVGPWLPFQMMAAGILGFCAGLLPKVNAVKLRLLLLSIWAVVGAYLYGALMTLWNWPYLAGLGTSISYQPGASLGSNLLRFLQFEVVTGGLVWDTGRAATTVCLVLLTAPALLATLDRVSRRAGVKLGTR